MCRLTFKVARSIGEEYDKEMVLSVQGLGCSKVRVLEVGDFDGVSVGDECEQLFGKGSALRLSSWNGGDIESLAGRASVIKVIDEVRPQCVWFRPSVSAFSPVQKLNQRTPEQILKLQAKQEQAKRQCEGLAEVFRATAARGITGVIEMPESSETWHQQWYIQLSKDLGLYEGCVRVAK